MRNKQPRDVERPWSNEERQCEETERYPTP